MSDQDRKFKSYYYTAIFSMLFAVVGFSYNAWRLENSEDNNNIRKAAFEVLTELAVLEQVVYAAHYDHDTVTGSPRKGWVKVGLIVDLSSLIDKSVTIKSLRLKNTWGWEWEKIKNSKESTDNVINSIDNVRFEIKRTLNNLN